MQHMREKYNTLGELEGKVFQHSEMPVPVKIETSEDLYG